MSLQHNRPLVLCILDGWGDGKPTAGNAILQARTPHFDHLKEKFPMSLLDACGTSVGLPQGQMGNSEVGHMTIGSGRVIQQDLSRITSALASDTFRELPAFRNFVKDVKAQKGVCHVLGLLSDGGVHSHSDHLKLLVRHLVNESLSVKIHAILDGRDTHPKAALDQIREFQKKMADVDVEIVSLGGRYFAMDRDQRWERIETAMDSIAAKGSATFVDSMAYIQERYDAGETDEFISPAHKATYTGFSPSDGLIAFNFRADRMRQILEKLTQGIELTSRLGFVSYRSDLDAYYPVLFSKPVIENTLGAVLSGAGMTQLRIAETEKYAHVTYFLNGGNEIAFAGEERTLIPSPKVATYDLKPEMSAAEVTDTVLQAIADETQDVIIVNYANPDMVGHSGDFAATVKAVECVDHCLGKVWSAVQSKGGILLVTADHGNADEMVNEATGEVITSHSLNPVPFIVASDRSHDQIEHGQLSDIAPTILDLMGLKKPVDMTGKSLVKCKNSSRLNISIS